MFLRGGWGMADGEARLCPNSVIPAHAGIQSGYKQPWMLTFVSMTRKKWDLIMPSIGIS